MGSRKGLPNGEEFEAVLSVVLTILPRWVDACVTNPGVLCHETMVGMSLILSTYN